MIYLDNAATTFPKPQCVIDAVTEFMQKYGGNPGRGGHYLSDIAAEKVLECREEFASLIGTKNPERIIFTKNTTEAINLAIKGTLKKGDEIIISSMEHNSVLRSCVNLEGKGITVKIARADHKGFVSADTVSSLITSHTKMICIIHASNVVGTVNPVREIYKIAQMKGIIMLVDAAQSGGILEIDTSCGDMIAFAGHKALYGPFGTGALYIKPGVFPDTLIEGGTGSLSESALMPNIFPDKYEAGTLNACGIAGLCEGIKFIKREGAYEKELAMARFLREEISAVKGVKILGDPEIGVVGIHTKAHDCVDICTRLNSEYHIASRAGLHCSPMAHRTLGTVTSGLLRFSTGFFNTKEEVSEAAKALEAVIKH